MIRGVQTQVCHSYIDDALLCARDLNPFLRRPFFSLYVQDGSSQALWKHLLPDDQKDRDSYSVLDMI